MIRAIAAIDDRLGLATDQGIPWTIPADVAHFRAAIASADVLMGCATYLELTKPLDAGGNYVATRRAPALRDGFEAVPDVASFIAAHDRHLWIVGGAGLYASTLASTDELVLTRVEGDFNCTKFFPAFEDSFELVTDSAPPPVEGSPAIRFQTWRHRPG